MPDPVSRRRALAATLGAAATLAAFGERVTAAQAPLPASDPGPVPSPLYGQGLLVQLPVEDVDRSIRFYTEVLGFRVTERRNDLGFVHLECGVPGLELGLSTGAPPLRSAGSLILNFSVKGDVEIVRAALERKGVRFTGPTQVIPGKVRLAPFEDPDGHRLRLAGQDFAGGASRE